MSSQRLIVKTHVSAMKVHTPRNAVGENILHARQNSNKRTNHSNNKQTHKNEEHSKTRLIDKTIQLVRKKEQYRLIISDETFSFCDDDQRSIIEHQSSDNTFTSFKADLDNPPPSKNK